MRVYVDTSALLRRVLAVDTHAAAAERYLAEHHAAGDTLESSVLARIETERALRARGLPGGYDLASAVEAALAGLEVVALTEDVAKAAGSIGPDVLRSLDAIHVATAKLDEVDAFVTYDMRQAAAATANGVSVVTPRT
ncbi:MAG: type II toxin-antitoxin system VapC family toxin [Bifidobacteriaceae bacterium]|jgi:predicted nucleic acid-binding protein|nr:type II toxin-antitoxin system VapC family toxin [Bifidobacteriaceae bacterium]